MTFVKRVARLGFNSAGYFYKSPTVNFSPSSLANRFGYRELSQLVNPDLVDKLALVSGLKAKGVPSEQADAITTAIVDIVEHVSQPFVSEAKMRKIAMTLESKLLEAKTAVLSSQRETKKLQSDIEKMGSELRYENKVRAGQCLVPNNEMGWRIQDEPANQKYETINILNKLCRETRALRDELEAASYNAFKLCIGSMTVAAVAVAVVSML